MDLMYFVFVSLFGHLLSASGLESDPLTVLLLSAFFVWGMVVINSRGMVTLWADSDSWWADGHHSQCGSIYPT